MRFSPSSLTLGGLAQRRLRSTLVRQFVCLSVCLSVCQFVCYHVFCNHVKRDNERAIPKGSALYCLDFKLWRLSYNYCVRKLWREKQVNKPIWKLLRAYLDRVRLLCSLAPRPFTISARVNACAREGVYVCAWRSGLQTSYWPAYLYMMPRVRAIPGFCSYILYAVLAG